MRRGFKINSDLSENQIEADVASYLGSCSPFWKKRFRIISVDEQLTGADKIFNKFVPLYLQFKKSLGLKSLNKKLQKSNLRTPLQKIREFRFTNSLSGSPILYFKLRDKAKTAKDFQHNILLSKHKPPSQFAFYVAPLTLSNLEYENKFQAEWWRSFIYADPFVYGDINISDGANSYFFHGIPFLRTHVSIPPHQKVTNSDHYYSYSKNGGDIVWHSGEKLSEDFRFSSQINNIYNSIILNPEETGLSQEVFSNEIDEFYTINEIDSNIRNLSFNEKVREYSSYLLKNFEIKLFMMGVTNNSAPNNSSTPLS
ncbi:MAG: hypothetical protein KDC34_18665 [Saprospiraceae bacterium]|nr:hypothetical protein [Saprospiraceae bacterium]